jgi:hypothetical protein
MREKIFNALSLALNPDCEPMEELALMKRRQQLAGQLVLDFRGGLADNRGMRSISMGNVGGM